MSRREIHYLHSYCLRETRRSEQTLSVAMGQHTREARRVKQFVFGTKVWKDLQSCWLSTRGSLRRDVTVRCVPLTAVCREPKPGTPIYVADAQKHLMAQLYLLDLL